MRTLRVGRLEIGIEFWCRPMDIENWQLGSEHDADAFKTRLYWFGPLHVAFCRLPRELASEPKWS
ncbi:MAG: hypothetical protein Q8K28_09535 [Hoeflea sp.]|uniref:hypothetical protein n=1 Tax=Hoeflea sp. TaxID=1940281 RepID=UPI002730676D|nr:hypothetical protein [Hoeflea sp.]MDP2120132.1 hypothetical protein [Hoeflea sp.]